MGSLGLRQALRNAELGGATFVAERPAGVTLIDQSLLRSGYVAVYLSDY